MRDALNSAMEEEMLRDDSVFILGEEVARCESLMQQKMIRMNAYTSFAHAIRQWCIQGHQGSAGQIWREAGD